MKMARFGVNGFDLYQELALVFRGEVVARFVKEQIPVSAFLRLPPADRNNLKSWSTVLKPENIFH